MDEDPKFEDRESIIDGLIKALAEKEGMDPEDISSDIVTFTELSGVDKDAAFYFEELAEKINIPFEELRQYAMKKAKGV